jgi:transcriptional regulator with XRE-family HTH domain
VAANLRRIRRERDVTTAELAHRLAAIGQPIPDTSITKAEKGSRRVDVDDLPALALALGVTPNTLLMPQVDLGASGSRIARLTPAADGTAEELWQWAQGEKPLRIPAGGACSWLGGGRHPDLEFSLRTRPYLTALRGPGSGTAHPGLQALAAAAADAMAAGATGPEVRRTVELTIALPAVMTREQIRRWIEDRTRPGGEGP